MFLCAMSAREWQTTMTLYMVYGYTTVGLSVLLAKVTIFRTKMSSSKFCAIEKCSPFSMHFARGLYVCGIHYPSVGHAYQASRCADHSEFCTGGKYSDWDWVLKHVNEARDPLDVSEYREAGCVGILAWLVSHRPLLFRLNHQSPDVFSYERWCPFFEAYFTGDLLQKLLRTEGVLYLRNERATADFLICGRVENGEMIGGNMYGKLLTRFRDSKRPKRKLECDTLSLEQALNKRFKTALRRGLVIHIDVEEDFLPFDWHTRTVDEKMDYAIDHDWTLDQCSRHLRTTEDPMYTPEPPVMLTWKIAQVESPMVPMKSAGGFRSETYKVSSEGKDLGRVLVVRESLNEDTRLKMAEEVTQVDFERAPACSAIRNMLLDKFDVLGAEVVFKDEPHVGGGITMNLSGERQLCFGAFYNDMPIGPRTQITIRPGDMYVCDFDFASESGLHIRQWSGGEEFIQRVEKDLLKKVKTTERPSKAAQYLLAHNRQEVITSPVLVCV